MLVLLALAMKYISGPGQGPTSPKNFVFSGLSLDEENPGVGWLCQRLKTTWLVLILSKAVAPSSYKQSPEGSSNRVIFFDNNNRKSSLLRDAKECISELVTVGFGFPYASLIET